MIEAVDHIIIAVEDLNAGVDSYRRLLGREPSWRGEHPGQGSANALFRLDNTYLELAAAVGEGGFATMIKQRLADHGEGVMGLAFRTPDADASAVALKAKGFTVSGPADGEGKNTLDGATRKWRNLFVSPASSRGLFLFLIEHTSPLDALPPSKPISETSPSAIVEAVDHVVVRTRDPDATKAFFGDDGLGIRLALDQDVEAWGGRMLFFRTGGLTVEVVGRQDEDLEKRKSDFYWGIAFRTRDVSTMAQRIANAGGEISEVRKGRKPGTVVATPKADTLNTPTLVIGPDPAQ
jgi:catechol 2,3-dioxygenase-like lactoylglutathione lyase family enzyme